MPKYKARVMWRLERWATVEIEATDADDALEKARTEQWGHYIEGPHSSDERGEIELDGEPEETHDESR